MTRANLTAAIAALGGFLFGYNTGVISGAILFLAAAFHLSTIMVGVVSSIALGGAAAGAVIAGQLADRFGRRPMLALTSLVFIIGAVISAQAQNVPEILAGRTLIGLGVGAASMLTPLYISETTQAQHRGRLVSFNQLAMTLGILVSNLIGYMFAATGDWRWMLGLGGIPAVLLGTGMWFLPETPCWLVSRGWNDKARLALRILRGDEDITAEFAQIMAEQNATITRPRQKSGRHFTFSMPLLIGISLAVFQQATGINTVLARFRSATAC